MASDAPQINLMTPLIQELLKSFEECVFGNEGFDECEDAIGKLYNEAFKKPYVCALIKDVLSGRWQLGTTQHEVSSQLGIADRTWVSRALRGGQLSLDAYLRLRVCPSRPADWEPDIVGLYPEMERSAFIAVAQYLAEELTDRQFIGVHRLNELNYELVCELFARLRVWLQGALAEDKGVALQIVQNVCSDTNRKVCPSWYLERHQREIKSEIVRLSTDASAAFNHLRLLQENWLDVFVAAHYLLEGIKWRP